MESMFLGIFGCMGQTILETHRTAASPLRFLLQSPDGSQPLLMVVLILYIRHLLRLQKSHQLVLADIELLLRIDIAIAEINGWLHAIAKHTLYDSRRTGCTTGMQQHLLTISLASIRESKFHEFILFFYRNLHITLNFDI